MLASAVANAVHNDEQDADELFVLACFADEGPTLRRFRPRARGRATRIRKRTCHITVVVARLSDERLEVLQNRQQAQSAAGRRRAGTSAQCRRDRVERSRTRAEGLRDGATEAGAEAADEAPAARRRRRPTSTSSTTTEVVVDDVAEELEDAQPSRRRPTSPRATSPTSRSRARRATEPERTARAAPSRRRRTGRSRTGYEIKGNANSMKYHVPGGRYYDVTIAEVFFDTAEHAEAAGYSAPATEDDELMRRTPTPIDDHRTTSTRRDRFGRRPQ